MPIFTQPAADPPADLAWLGYRAPLLSGEQGTAQTVDLMRQLIDEALTDQKFVRTAVNIVHAVPAYHDLGEAEALYDWVKRNIRFTKDPVTKEKLYPPQELLKIKAGDCDDISMLLGAFLLALGYPARLVTIGASRDHPEEFSHVYVEAEVPPGSGQWVPMDAARADSEFAVEPPSYFRKRAWSLIDNSYQDLAGWPFVHANTVGSGRQRGLGSYGYVHHRSRAGIGDFSDWMPAIQQSIAEVPAIISVATGQKSTVTSPYGSFSTGYTPGYGVPQAGYTAPGLPGSSIAVGLGGSIWPWIAGAAVLMMVMGRRGGGR